MHICLYVPRGKLDRLRAIGSRVALDVTMLTYICTERHANLLARKLVGRQLGPWMALLDD